MSEKKKPIGSILLKHRVLSSRQLAEALRNQRRGDPPLVSALVEQGVIRDHEALKALSEQSGCPGIDLNQVVIRAADLSLVPRQLAERHCLLPVLVKGNRMFVAMADPADGRVLQELEMVTGKKAFPYISLKSSLRHVITDAYTCVDHGQSHYVGPKCSPETLRKAGIAPPPSDSGSGQGGVILPQRGRRSPPVDESPSVQLERHMRPGLPPSLHSGQGSGQVVIVDDTMAASQREDPGILFDDPTFAELEVQSDVAQQPYPTSSQQGAETLLVVDPDEEARRRVAEVFTEQGYRVLEADRGDSALQMVSHYAPDVMILEATLPGVHGFEVARQLKFSERYRNIRIVMTSNHYRGWRIAEDLKANFRVDGFVEKPYKIDDVVHEVDKTRLAADSQRAAGTSAEAEPYLNAGIAAYKAGRIDEAIAQLRAGTQVDPLAYKVHFHLGLLYGKNGQLFDGIQELETVLGIRSDFFPALKNLAVLYQNAGFRNKAIEMWERCLANAPDEATRDTIKRHLVAVL